MRTVLTTAALLIGMLSGGILQAETITVKVWPDGPPGARISAEYQEETVFDQGKPRIKKVTDPVLLVYLPPPEKANGTAVVICPGGGYTLLAIDHEGYDIAAWLNEMGIAGIILKYRLPSDQIMEDKTIGPLQDAQEAIRIVRRRAAEWRIDPNRIGIMGFSAGGHLAATASTHFADVTYTPADSTSARPDFSILLYPVISLQRPYVHGGSRNNLLGPEPDEALVERFSNERHVAPDTPPAFLVHSGDDRSVPVNNSIVYYQALLANDVPAELHIYQKGGHGYGLAPQGGTESGWPEACRRWLKTRGLVQ
ncbi:MAG TPA: alpha/beta hydrolase [Acidobacteriota bacterium]|nr:alpha/beta hydrolase [Acidobacteriota bacterium]